MTWRSEDSDIDSMLARRHTDVVVRRIDASGPLGVGVLERSRINLYPPRHMLVSLSIK